MTETAPWGMPAGMSTRSGLPCRGGCDRIFTVGTNVVVAGSSAAQARNDHELEAHGYTHKPLPDEPAQAFSRPVRLKGHRAGRRLV